MTASQTVRLSFHTPEAQATAARFLSRLVREGVTFRAEATADDLELVITFTGGY